ncbi:MAG: hypothetical protein WC519_01765 [Parcubacteria group bacterium]
MKINSTEKQLLDYLHTFNCEFKVGDNISYKLDVIFSLVDNHNIEEGRNYRKHTKLKTFDVKESKDGHWFTFNEVREKLDDKDRFDEIAERIFSTLNI